MHNKARVTCYTRRVLYCYMKVSDFSSLFTCEHVHTAGRPVLFFLNPQQEWNTKLEQLAQDWADGCNFVHRRDTPGVPTGFSYNGENLYAATRE